MAAQAGWQQFSGLCRWFLEACPAAWDLQPIMKSFFPKEFYCVKANNGVASHGSCNLTPHVIPNQDGKA